MHHCAGQMFCVSVYTTLQTFSKHLASASANVSTTTPAHQTLVLNPESAVL